MAKSIFFFCGLFTGLSVVIGAFGAHFLKNKLSVEMASVFKTGIEYQFYHSLGLGLVGLSLVASASSDHKWLHWSFYFMVAGILMFSGSLYALALTRIKWFGPITPLGGLAFIAAWVCFSVHWLRS